jgi:hypothetical protein
MIIVATITRVRSKKRANGGVYDCGMRNAERGIGKPRARVIGD